MFWTLTLLQNPSSKLSYDHECDSNKVKQASFQVIRMSIEQKTLSTKCSLSFSANTDSFNKKIFLFIYLLYLNVIIK